MAEPLDEHGRNQVGGTVVPDKMPDQLSFSIKEQGKRVLLVLAIRSSAERGSASRSNIRTSRRFHFPHAQPPATPLRVTDPCSVFEFERNFNSRKFASNLAPWLLCVRLGAAPRFRLRQKSKFWRRFWHSHPGDFGKSLTAQHEPNFHLVRLGLD